MKILVVAPNWIGDCLMAQPLLAILKQHPPTHLTLLAAEWVAPIAQLMPEVDAVIPSRFAHGAWQWRARRILAHELAQQQFDCAYVLPNSFKSALIPWFANIPLRFGYQGELRGRLLSARLANPKKRERPLMHAHYAALARLAGLALPHPLPSPRLQVPHALRQAAQRCLQTYGIAPDGAYWVFAPGAEYGPAKRWPSAHFAALAAQALQANPSLQIVVLGASAERTLAAEMWHHLQIQSTPAESARCHNLCGVTTLDMAAAILGGAQRVVSNDSGLMHIAAALQIPQVALFGSSDPRHTPPLSPQARVLWLQLSCSPCFKRVCPFGTLACLQQITPTRVEYELELLSNQVISTESL